MDKMKYWNIKKGGFYDRKEKLIILSRNNPIEILCDACVKNRRRTCAQNAFMREKDGCVKTVQKHMSAESVRLSIFYKSVNQSNNLIIRKSERITKEESAIKKSCQKEKKQGREYDVHALKIS